MHAFAFVFPGQGSQSVGMLDAWGDHPAVRQTLTEASAALALVLSPSCVRRRAHAVWAPGLGSHTS